MSTEKGKADRRNKTNMQYTATLGNRQFIIESNTPLSPEQVSSYVAQKLQGGCPSCASAKTAGGIPKLGTATCGGPYIKGSEHTLTGSVTSGGTAPFTYTWTITPPTGSAVTLTGASQTYVFALVGIYTINLSVSDSCLDGAKTDSAACNVTVTAICVGPVCTINIA